MAERMTIYVGEPLALVLAGFDDQRSGRINQVAADYLSLIEQLTPALTSSEWHALIDALNGLAIDDNRTLRFAWMQVRGTEGLGEKWGINQDDLADKITAAPLSVLIALREVLSRYWTLAGGHESADALRLAGAKITGEQSDARSA